MDKTKRDSFVFFRSYFEAIEEADTKSQLELYRSIALYALNREEPNLKGLVKSAWIVIKPIIDANHQRYINGCKGGPHGKKGGAPKGNTNARKQPQNNPKTTRNDNDKCKMINVNDNVEQSGSPPTLKEVELFFRNNSNSSDNSTRDAQMFYHSFSSVGWVDRNGKAIANWRAVAQTWIKRWFDIDRKNSI